MICDGNKIIGQLVAEDYRMAEVFTKYGIDYSCKGNISIDAVVKKKKIDLKRLLSDLREASIKEVTSSSDFRTWPSDLLVDYIEKKHHHYTKAKIPLVLGYLRKICLIHGKHHPELFEVMEHFKDSSRLLLVHMREEEESIFPKLRRNLRIESSEKKRGCKDMENTVQKLNQEHLVEAERFHTIEALCSGYVPPRDACGTYRTTLYLLNDFQTNLMFHLHLENNILFTEEYQKKIIQN